MAEKNTEIFLPINFQKYKESKVFLLKTQMRSISSIERLRRINEIRKLKEEQKKLLYKTIKEIKHYSEKITKLLPTEKEVEIKGVSISRRRIVDSNFQNTATTRVQPRIAGTRIDSELAKIQEKIANLNL